MAKPWKPPPPHQRVSDGETIGRRLFGSSFLEKSGAVKWDCFFDKRPASDLSVDRLGIETVHPSVPPALRPQCDEIATQTGKVPFFGWAILRVAEVRRSPISLDVVPKPVTTPPVNNYHAEIPTSARPIPEQQLLALALATKSKVHPISSEPISRWERFLARGALYAKRFLSLFT